MREPTQKELLQALQDVKTELSRFEKMVKKLVPEKEWYTTQEFALKKGIKHKTVSNYVGKGRYNKVRKNAQGQWEIHRSEL